MYKIKIVSIGKNKEKWLEEAVNEYIKRLKPIALIECVWLRDNEQLLQFVEKEPLSVCLDLDGSTLNSHSFSEFIQTRLLKGGSRLTFIIGGADGLPLSLRTHPYRLSMSDLTMTHQIIRLVLIEQIYRAFEIAKGSPYHK